MKVEIDNYMRDRVVRLFTYLKELAKLSTKVTRDISSYDEVLWFSEIPNYRGCSSFLFSQEQEAVEAAPKILDPTQQTVITLLRGYLSSPLIKRNSVKDAMQCLSQPMTHTSVRTLRKAYEEFLVKKDIEALVKSIRAVRNLKSDSDEPSESRGLLLKREDLHLVCFDFVWS